MKIAYSGSFLGEGLRQLGHDVTDLHPDAATSLTETLDAAGLRPDLVLLELWGNNPFPRDLAHCPYRLALYAIDTPLNAFWLRHLAQVGDDIFVDQRAGVADFATQGVRAVWLPLCVSSGDIMPETSPDLFLSFVGRTTVFRNKRNNLLRLVGNRFPLHQAQNLSRREMLALFARSRVVLNENLFSGLTLRVFQGLASGAAVLTETGDGLEALFEPGKHLVTYDADTVLGVLAELERHPDTARDIGRRGRQYCAAFHTSLARATSFLESLARDAARTPRRDPAARRLAEARARYAHAQRHGGPFVEAMRTFATIISQGGALAPLAAHDLGSIMARQGDIAGARQLLPLAVTVGGLTGCLAAAKLALTFLYADDLPAAQAALETALTCLPQALRPQTAPGLAHHPQPRLAFFTYLAEALLAAGHVFDLGFLKPHPELFPDYALEYAALAWEQAHTAHTLDLRIRCAKACRAESELMDTLLAAIKEGVASDHQMLYAAELAFRLYDPATARTITASLRQARRSPPA